MLDGEPHYWSGAAPWRAEIFGGDEPWDKDVSAGAAPPGPGAYETPAHLQFGAKPHYAKGPSPGFASGVFRDGAR